MSPPQQPTMKISARKVFEGRVVGLTPGLVNTEVRLALAGGDTLVAVISSASAGALSLVPGAAARALIKASDVVLAA